MGLYFSIRHSWLKVANEKMYIFYKLLTYQDIPNESNHFLSYVIS